MNNDQYEIPWEKLRRVTNPGVFSFVTTAEIEPLTEVFGQDRAVRAIRFGLDISSSGFNLFLAGQPGTGKTQVLKRILNEVAKSRAVPDDTLYVHNFDDPDAPRVLRLPAGKGVRFRDELHELVQDLRELVPKSFESKEYVEQQRHIVEETQRRQGEMLKALQQEAQQLGLQIQSSPQGFHTIPMRDDKPLSEKEYEQMSADERTRLDGQISEIEKKLRNFMLEVRELNRASKEQLKEIDRQVAMNVLDQLTLDLEKKYGESEEVREFLRKVQKDIIENIGHFRHEEETIHVVGLPQRRPPDFTRYAVNLVVDNSDLQGAPVVIETNPTYHNLVGRIEKRAQLGNLVTDFTMIRSGSLAKANGGYLVVDIDDALRNPFVYEALKHAVRNKEVRIEDLSERVGLFSAQTLKPEPVPLDVKVCLVGKPYYYHLLFAFDEDFRESFKVKADFDYETELSDTNIENFAAFVARLKTQENLPEFDPTAIAAVIDEGSRWIEDQKKISVQFGQVNDLIRQAAYWAQKMESEVVTADHVERAIEEIDYRSSLTKERVQEYIQRNILMVDTDGESVGQMNGLAVHMLGDYRFGRPTKITASVAIGNEGVINIERRALLSHSTHDKGVLILSGFLNERFAQELPLSLTASLTFEQSYSEVTGDSASSTELYVLLSALSGLPVKQGIAVTGSVNQKGKVQAIGAVNQKIEGFFEICQARGLTGEQGVIIPKANLPHLMLRKPVLEAVKAGKFHVWAVSHVDEGIEILTGVASGKQDEYGDWPTGSVNDRVQSRLIELAEKLRSWSTDGAPPKPELLLPGDTSPSPPPPPPPDRPRM